MFEYNDNLAVVMLKTTYRTDGFVVGHLRTESPNRREFISRTSTYKCSGAVAGTPSLYFDHTLKPSGLSSSQRDSEFDVRGFSYTGEKSFDLIETVTL